MPSGCSADLSDIVRKGENVTGGLDTYTAEYAMEEIGIVVDAFEESFFTGTRCIPMSLPIPKTLLVAEMNCSMLPTPL